MAGNRYGDFLAGALIGTLIGATLGVLYAPQSGEKTRKMIKKQLNDAKKQAVSYQKEAMTKMEQWKREATLGANKARKGVKTAKSRSK